MGRIKGFFCSLCMDRNADATENDHSFSQGIDVSHLATPHVYSSPPHTRRPSPVTTPNCDTSNDTGEPRDQTDHSNINSPAFHPQEHERLQPSPLSQEPQQQSQQQQQSQPQSQPQSQQRSALANQPQDPPPARNIPKEPATKLSYDIISVREPLAKILAERQQLQLAQQHEYIEVYGERGSSCFYEEIAGSTTSSATYDQIGVSSNHNYQVLINAYVNRPNEPRIENDGNEPGQDNSQDGSSANDPQEENIYQIEDASGGSEANHPNALATIVSQSIPVYSVINKATRRSNAIIRATVDSCCPPQPPPKNPPSHHPSTSAINTYQEPSTIVSTQSLSVNRNSPQLPSTSSYISGSNNTSESKDNSGNHSRLPQPPPRSTRHTMFKATNRPLPLPDKFVHANSSNGLDYSQMRHNDENGYELLTTNFDDDQIDAGYEKIRESNRYSGGSISSQLRALQVLDNGGYESVQPIYSSPSNLVEPNYEAIGPSTASEIAAAATARLNAAAAVIVFKQDQS